MRVIIADDAVIVRQGVARLLAERGIEVVGEAGRTEELLRLVAALRPDVAVIDIRMPPTQTDEGLVAAREIRRRFPAVGTLVLSQHAESGYAFELIAGGDGSVGYLLKDRVVDVDQLVDALDRIRAGGVVVEPALVDGLLARSGRLGVLTSREREVLALVAQGKTDRGIALELGVTRKTVEAHVRSILAKLELPEDVTENRRVHAVLAFLQAGGGHESVG
jgi:DNA-binding NarL/FixJ family response regulator